MRMFLAALVAGLAVAGAFAPTGGATNECRGIMACIRVPGPWVLVPPGGRVQYLLSCPGGRSVVGGLDAQATSRAVRVGFEGRLGAPVGPGVTTTRYALFRAVSTREATAGVPAAAGMRAAAGRRRPFDSLRACDPRRAVDRVPVAHRHHRSRPGQVCESGVQVGREARRLVARDRVPRQEAADARERVARRRDAADRR